MDCEHLRLYISRNPPSAVRNRKCKIAWTRFRPRGAYETARRRYPHAGIERPRPWLWPDLRRGLAGKGPRAGQAEPVAPRAGLLYQPYLKPVPVHYRPTLRRRAERPLHEGLRGVRGGGAHELS